jgi:outer membrane protein assembly factor BamB
VVFVTNWTATDIAPGAAEENSQTYVQAIDAVTGAARWSYNVRESWPSPPAVTEKYVVFSTSPRTGTTKIILHVLNRSTGELVWRYDGVAGKDYWKAMSTRNQMQRPAVVNDELVVVATDNSVVAFDLDTGQERWRLTEPFQTEWINQVAWGSAVYVIAGDTLTTTFGHFYGIDLHTGKVLWSTRMISRNVIRAVFDPVIYVNVTTLGLGPSMVAFNAADGKELATIWKNLPFSRASGEVCFGPVRHGDRVLMSTLLQEIAGQGSSPGRLYSLAPPSERRTGSGR